MVDRWFLIEPDMGVSSGRMPSTEQPEFYSSPSPLPGTRHRLNGHSFSSSSGKLMVAMRQY